MHAHLAALGIEATACVTILDRIIRRPPPPPPPSVERFSHGAGCAENQVYRAYDKLARLGRANDKLARSGRALCGAAKANDKLARSGRAPYKRGKFSICKSQRHFVSTAAAILKEVSLLRNFSPVSEFAYGVTAPSVCGGGYFASSSSTFDRFSV